MPSTERIVITALSVTTSVFVITSAICITLLVVRPEKDASTPPYEEPERLVSVFEYRNWAKNNMEVSAWNYFEDGATEQTTLEDNVKAYERYRLMPRYMHNVSHFDSSLELFGERVESPIGISPFAYQKWANIDGESATARAAEKFGTVYILSASASTTIEDVSAAAPNVIKWMQLYPWAKQNETLYFIRRAENAGFKGIVVTIDRPVGSIRYNARKGLAKVPDYVKDVNFSNSTMAYQMELANAAQSWNDILWIVQQTDLPVIVKGLLNANELSEAADAGVSGILVSNHGGRVLDGVAATIDVLVHIASTAHPLGLEVFLDGGIRRGVDVFKAVALGAKMVFVARPVAYGLAHSGQEGVEAVLDILNEQFINTAQLCGAQDLSQIEQSMVML